MPHNLIKNCTKYFSYRLTRDPCVFVSTCKSPMKTLQVTVIDIREHLGPGTSFWHHEPSLQCCGNAALFGCMHYARDDELLIHIQATMPHTY